MGAKDGTTSDSVGVAVGDASGPYVGLSVTTIFGRFVGSGDGMVTCTGFDDGVLIGPNVVDSVGAIDSTFAGPREGLRAGASVAKIC